MDELYYGLLQDQGTWVEEAVHPDIYSPVVERHAPNPYGLFDILGNVTEASTDELSSPYFFDPGGAADPVRTGGDYKSSLGLHAGLSTNWVDSFYEPPLWSLGYGNGSYSWQGFRLARTAP